MNGWSPNIQIFKSCTLPISSRGPGLLHQGLIRKNASRVVRPVPSPNAKHHQGPLLQLSTWLPRQMHHGHTHGWPRRATPLPMETVVFHRQVVPSGTCHLGEADRPTFWLVPGRGRWASLKSQQLEIFADIKVKTHVRFCLLDSLVNVLRMLIMEAHGSTWHECLNSYLKLTASKSKPVTPALAASAVLPHGRKPEGFWIWWVSPADRRCLRVCFSCSKAGTIQDTPPPQHSSWKLLQGLWKTGLFGHMKSHDLAQLSRWLGCTCSSSHKWVASSHLSFLLLKHSK